MKRYIVLAAMLAFAGCTPLEPETAPGTITDPVRGDLGPVQDGWDDFYDHLDWGLHKQLNRAVISEVRYDELRDNLRDWTNALFAFEDVVTLRSYVAVGWWGEFVDIVTWDADDRGDWRTRDEAEDYDKLTRGVIR